MKDIHRSEMGNIYISSEQIIQEVQKFRCLYDPSHPDHKDRDVMRDAWVSVSAAVVGEPWDNLNSAEKNEAEKDLKRRWKHMRDAFLKSIKGGCFLSPRARVKKRPYIYSKQMSFLLETEHFKEYIPDDVNIPPTPSDPVEAVKSMRPVDTERPRPDFRILRPGTDNKSPPRPFNLTMQKDYSYEKEDSSISCHSSNSVPHNTGHPKAEDPDRMFLLSLVPTMSALNSRDKLDFQISIMQLLQKYETEDPNS